MLEQLKKNVYKANMELWNKGLVIYTWGNVSGIDRDKNLVVIKPSGVDYNLLRWEDMSVVDFDGNIVEGDLRPSSDTPTHIELYKKYMQIGGVVHTHSPWAVSFAQAGKDILPFGTTHADYFFGPIPCTRELSKKEIEQEYEKNTGKVIIEAIGNKDPMAVPGINVKSHGPFAWGKNSMDSVHNAVVMEEIAKMAFNTMMLNRKAEGVSQYLLDKHYYRKHGENAYYGQK